MIYFSLTHPLHYTSTRIILQVTPQHRTHHRLVCYWRLHIGDIMAALSNSGPQKSPYHDQPLGPGEIRLLTIETRTDTTNEPSLRHVFPWMSSVVTLRLVTRRHKLEDKPEFNALSYVWGTAPASIEVPCNESQLRVTPSAYEMLEQLQPQNIRPFWIDAICIDQQNAEEKATQIPLMRHIYAHAAYVVIWMAALNPSIRVFMLGFPRVLNLANNRTPKTAEWNNPGWRGQNWPRDDDKFWEGLY